MRNNYRSRKFKTWLDQLQQESWQLELLISGFAIYGLFQAIGPLEIKSEFAQNTNSTFLAVVYSIGVISCYILAFTLLLHIVLRGLWIGALGLRYVSGDIDFKKLNYAPKFDRYLRKRIGSFDRYIASLEDYCSVLFALSFLLIFYLLSIFLFFGSITGIALLFFQHDGDNNLWLISIGGIIVLFLVLGMFLVFIDFLTQGFLKKKKWLAFIYFPFYWVFSFITLSFLYRPLVYNFLDNKFGRRISLALIPIYAIAVYIVSLDNVRSNYLSTESSSSTFFANSLNYDTVLEKENVFIEKASIPSKVISKSYLPVFIEYQNRIEDYIFEHNPGLKLDKDLRGFASTVSFSLYDAFKGKKDSLRQQYMTTLKEIHVVRIDSVMFLDLEYVFTQNKNKQEGFETVIPLRSIAEGKHILHISRISKDVEIDKTEIDTIKVATIPFWFYQNK